MREWLEIRIGLDELIRSQLTEYRVPKNINIFYTLGMVAFAAFLFQVFTGILLIFYYIPDDKDAFESVSFIMNHVPYGWLFRLMHVVGSNLMVAVVLLHMGSVFFLGSYKKPRELTWVVGVSAVADDSRFLPQRLSSALEPAEFLGDHGGDQYTYGLSVLWRPYL